MYKFETFSTTADVGIRIRGSGFEDLLHSAINGLNFLFFDQHSFHSPAPSIYHFEFNGDSAENILVNLLSEIVFLLQNENKITTGMNIKEVNETYLNADLLTIPSDKEPNIEIKSVTYHNLKIKRKKNSWSAEVIFDI